VAEHLVAAERLDGHAEGERLRDRLNRERVLDIARLEHVAAGGNQADRELLRRHAGQLRNVGRDLTTGERPITFVQLVDQGLDFVLGAVHGLHCLVWEHERTAGKSHTGVRS
jgi:hypothetical protein